MAKLSYTINEVEEELTPRYAGMHVNDNSTSQSIPTGSTYVKLNSFSENDSYYGMTPDYTSDKITISKAGIYKVSGSFSMLSGTSNVVFYFSIFVDSVEFDNIHFSRKISVSGDVGSGSFSGFLDLSGISSYVDVDVRVRHDNASSVNLTIRYANLSIFKIKA